MSKGGANRKPEVRAKISAALKRKWANPEFYAQQVASIREGKSRPGYVSGKRPPPTDKPRFLTILLPAQLYNQILAQATRDHTSMAEVVRKYLDWGIETEEPDESL